MCQYRPAAVYEYGVVNAANIKNLKYGLAKTHNEQYINHLRVKAREFQYRSEYNLLRDVFNKEEYLKWKEQHPRSLL